jgi:ABC-type Na+ transport system ATPase subunit NatA
MALLFSTQSVDEAADRGDRMLVLVRGRVAFAGTADELSATYGADDPEAAFLALLEAVA